MTHVRLEYCLFTHPNRPHGPSINEDAVLAAGRVYQGRREAVGEVAGEQLHLFAVSDGLHGVPCAALASRSLLEKLQHIRGSNPARGVAEAMEELQDGFTAEVAVRPECQGMACTLLVAEVRGYDARILHVGDSRAWHIRAGRATRLTRDHTVLEGMIRDGEVDPSDADRYASIYGMLENYFMASPYQSAPEYDTITLPLVPGDLLLLATDGISMLSDGDVSAASEVGFERMPEALFRAAGAAGSDDNISIVLVRVG